MGRQQWWRAVKSIRAVKGNAALLAVVSVVKGDRTNGGEVHYCRLAEHIVPFGHIPG